MIVFNLQCTIHGKWKGPELSSELYTLSCSLSPLEELSAFIQFETSLQCKKFVFITVFSTASLLSVSICVLVWGD